MSHIFPELDKPPRFKIGDVVWISGHERPIRYEATVVYVFPNGQHLPNCSETHYVVEISTHVEDYFDLRSETTTWKTKDEPHNWFMPPSVLRKMKEYVNGRMDKLKGI